MTKPLAKSLHTVTVLVRLARFVSANFAIHAGSDEAVDEALDILGLRDMPDPYGLRAAALKQLQTIGGNL
jgi:hypothetical protein